MEEVVVVVAEVKFYQKEGVVEEEFHNSVVEEEVGLKIHNSVAEVEGQALNVLY